MLRTPTLIALLLLTACAVESDEPALAPDAQVLAVSAPWDAADGGPDLADSDCSIVLRQAWRPISQWGGYIGHYAGPSRWAVWQVQVDVDDELLADGATPGLLFSATHDSTWWEVVDHVPADGETPEGMSRFTFQLDEQGLDEAHEPPRAADAALELIPVLHLADGTRLFDHNRVSDPLAAYTLENDKSWTVLDDGATCWGEQGKPVRLVEAKVGVTRTDSGGWMPELDTVLWGTVQTRPSDDPSSNVQVHYQVWQSGSVVQDWSWAPATQVDETRWDFAVPSYPTACPHYCYVISYRFAVGWWADGEEHWDNLGGIDTDYRLAGDFGGIAPVFRGPPAILDQPVRLAWASYQDGQFAGEVLVRDLAWNKAVTVVWSNDGWATIHELPAGFIHTPLAQEMEVWQFSAALDPGDGEIAFAVRYETDGQVWWDNNGELDYAVGTAAPGPWFVPSL